MNNSWEWVTNAAGIKVPRRKIPASEISLNPVIVKGNVPAETFHEKIWVINDIPGENGAFVKMLEWFCKEHAIPYELRDDGMIAILDPDKYEKEWNDRLRGKNGKENNSKK